MDDRVSAELAGQLAALAADGPWLRGGVHCACDGGAVGTVADPARTGLCPVFSGGAVCDRVRRLPHRGRNRSRGRPARLAALLWRAAVGYRAAGADAYLSRRISPH